MVIEVRALVTFGMWVLTEKEHEGAPWVADRFYTLMWLVVTYGKVH